MSDYNISTIYSSDSFSMDAVERLLTAEGIRKDANLDYTCVISDKSGDFIATGSCYGNTLRCLAVSGSHQGEGLMNEIVSHLMEIQFLRGFHHLFLYTKCSSAPFFRDLGFHEIARVDQQVVFMENRRTGFSDYLNLLTKQSSAFLALPGPAAALVMNANPFTLGHQYLAEAAASQNRVLHLFLVSEDASLFPYEVRKRLVMEGTSHLNNIVYHDTGPYLISNATFPSYFQKDENAVIESHARLDLAIFTRIAGTLGITRRFVGEEPFSQVTGLYNEIMKAELPKAGIDCIVIPRKTQKGRAISASDVRRAIQLEEEELLASLVPRTTLQYLKSDESAEIRERIKNEKNVVHY